MALSLASLPNFGKLISLKLVPASHLKSVKLIFTTIEVMPTIAISPKFQIFIPKSIRQSLNLVAGQQLELRVGDGYIQLIPQLSMTALRGLCPGIDLHVPDDPERITWPLHLEPVPRSTVTPSAVR